MRTAMSRPPKRLASILMTSLVALGISMPVSAQIEDITVTATKRDQDVQYVPVAVTDLSSETIDTSY